MLCRNLSCISGFGGVQKCQRYNSATIGQFRKNATAANRQSKIRLAKGPPSCQCTELLRKTKALKHGKNNYRHQDQEAARQRPNRNELPFKSNPPSTRLPFCWFNPIPTSATRIAPRHALRKAQVLRSGRPLEASHRTQVLTQDILFPIKKIDKRPCQEDGILPKPVSFHSWKEGKYPATKGLKRKTTACKEAYESNS